MNKPHIKTAMPLSIAVLSYSDSKMGKMWVKIVCMRPKSA